MILHRDGEFEVFTGARHARFTEHDGRWWAHTREGWELGPHHNHGDAIESLNDYLQFILHADARTLEHFYRTCLAGRKVH